MAALFARVLRLAGATAIAVAFCCLLPTFAPPRISLGLWGPPAQFSMTNSGQRSNMRSAFLRLPMEGVSPTSIPTGSNQNGNQGKETELCANSSLEY
jgi:hypothetical protein